MTRVPATYGDLSDDAKAAYTRWNDALLEKAEHVIDCSECSIGRGECGKGIALYEHEQRVWSEWNDARRLERK